MNYSGRQKYSKPFLIRNRINTTFQQIHLSLPAIHLLVFSLHNFIVGCQFTCVYICLINTKKYDHISFNGLMLK